VQSDRGPDEADLRASLEEAERFAAIFERRVREIHRYVWLKAGAAAAEDLTAEVFARAFAGRRSFDPESASVRAWLYGIANVVVRHHFRSDSRRRAREEAVAQALTEHDDGTAGPLSNMSETRELVEGLSSKLRDVVLLVAGAELSYADAATALGVPVGTVRSRYSRARKQLQRELRHRTQDDTSQGASA
jgi:RNA polymerase sigma factor (sigma-70 family)